MVRWGHPATLSVFAPPETPINELLDRALSNLIIPAVPRPMQTRPSTYSGGHEDQIITAKL